MAIETTMANRPPVPVPPILVEPWQWEELSAILKARLPGRCVWAFGSRATGERVRRYSDLDLLIDGDDFSFREAASLEEALDESRLPFKVDVVQAATLTPEFRARIEPDLVLIQGQVEQIRITAQHISEKGMAAAGKSQLKKHLGEIVD